jgi:phosphopantetheine adenylyltransferase
MQCLTFCVVVRLSRNTQDYCKQPPVAHTYGPVLTELGIIFFVRQLDCRRFLSTMARHFYRRRHQ